MKKVAVLIYSSFCSFEISVALEMLTMAEKPFVVFAKDLSPVRSEEGLLVVPEKAIADIAIDEYDALLLPGAADIREAIEDDATLTFIKKFDQASMTIGAISIAPLLLLKNGMLKDKHFMIGANRSELAEEGFTADEMALMTDWEEAIANSIPGDYIQDGHIITSVSYGFVKWAMAFGRMLGLEVYPRAFGLDE